MNQPVPEKRIDAFESMAFGLFVHWGLYSQLGQGEWIQHNGGIPKEQYQKLKDTFTAERFDARALARTARRAGMKYITLTTRHHDGFSLYDTCGLNDYDAPHSPAASAPPIISSAHVSASAALNVNFFTGCSSSDSNVARGYAI